MEEFPGSKVGPVLHYEKKHSDPVGPSRGRKMRCKTCGAPAKHKCTRCGDLFCIQHIRYGNPHFALWSPTGSVGYYCDNCWEFYRKQGERARKFLLAFIGGIGIIWLIWLLTLCFILSTFARIFSEIR